MPTPNQAALDFLLTRRSRPWRTITAPVPDDATIKVLLTAAARSPDHGKLEPWRFVVLRAPALRRIAGLVDETGRRLGKEQDQIAKERGPYEASDLAVMVVTSPKPSPKIPEIEQIYSAGAACMGLLNSALAAGWAANWLSGWITHDPEFVATHLGLTSGEYVAGIIHLGTETTKPPERPRPDIEAITTWVDT